MFNRIFKTKLTKEDYDRLNPPSILAYKEGVGMFELRLDNDDRWLPAGHFPKPRTKLGWFVYHMAHGLMMRYPPLAVIRWSFANMDIDEREKANASEPAEIAPTETATEKTGENVIDDMTTPEAAASFIWDGLGEEKARAVAEAILARVGQ